MRNNKYYKISKILSIVAFVSIFAVCVNVIILSSKTDGLTGLGEVFGLVFLGLFLLFTLFLVGVGLVFHLRAGSKFKESFLSVSMALYLISISVFIFIFIIAMYDMLLLIVPLIFSCIFISKYTNYSREKSNLKNPQTKINRSEEYSDNYKYYLEHKNKINVIFILILSMLLLVFVFVFNYKPEFIKENDYKKIRINEVMSNLDIYDFEEDGYSCYAYGIIPNNSIFKKSENCKYRLYLEGVGRFKIIEFKDEKIYNDDKSETVIFVFDKDFKLIEKSFEKNYKPCSEDEIQHVVTEDEAIEKMYNMANFLYEIKHRKDTIIDFFDNLDGSYKLEHENYIIEYDKFRNSEGVRNSIDINLIEGGRKYSVCVMKNEDFSQIEDFSFTTSSLEGSLNDILYVFDKEFNLMEAMGTRDIGYEAYSYEELIDSIYEVIEPFIK